LVKTDCIWEAILQILIYRPLRMLAILGGGWRGTAWMKRALGREALLPVESLPYNAEVIALIAQARAAGRKVLLVTASDQLMGDAVAAHLKLFDEVIGSDGVINVRGTTKAALLVKKFGRGGFDYAGDSAVDIPVWEAARYVIAVNPESAARRWVAQRGSGTVLGTARHTGRALARAAQPERSILNALVFIPALFAHVWGDGPAWTRLGLFFVALCFGASAVYLINGLADIVSDRMDKDKCRGPLAAGELLIVDAVLAIALCLAAAIGCCSFAGWAATGLLASYLAGAFGCSFWHGKARILEVLFFAGSCVFRILAGALLVVERLQ
jgi:hypothetical protein